MSEQDKCPDCGERMEPSKHAHMLHACKANQNAALRDENEWLWGVVGADDDYFRLLQVGALRGLRSHPTEAEKQEKMDAWQRCCDARKAARKDME